MRNVDLRVQRGDGKDDVNDTQLTQWNVMNSASTAVLPSLIPIERAMHYDQQT
jgi:hypothetical protein